MICERCKKKSATIHLTELIKDDKSEAHLCEGCAREIGLNSRLSNFSLSVSDMLSFFDINEINFDENYDHDNNGVCRSCGITFMDFKKNGKLGCEDCYIFLENPLNSVITSYHGENKHIGKMPAGHRSIDGESYKKLSEIQENVDSEETSIIELKKKLELAIFEERYEDAASLRDIIRNLE